MNLFISCFHEDERGNLQTEANKRGGYCSQHNGVSRCKAMNVLQTDRKDWMNTLTIDKAALWGFSLFFVTSTMGEEEGVKARA